MEKEFEVYKRPENLLEQLRFVATHHVSPNTVEIQRSAALGSIESIKELIERHEISIERIVEISKDEELQAKFLKIIKHTEEDKYTLSFRSLDEIMDLPRDEQAGWMLYSIFYDEKKEKIKLLTDQERSLRPNVQTKI